MRVLVACERSGVVREAFRRAGHDAMSCDLEPTDILEKPACGHWANQTPSGQNRLGPSPERARIRARTYEGIAAAMASQWTPERIDR